MSTYVPSWADVKASWSDGWKALSDQAVATYDAAIRANPIAYAEQITGFTSALAESRQHLDSIPAKLPNPPVTDADRKAVADYQAMEKRYVELAAGFYSDAVPADQATGVPVVGVAPIVVVAGVAIGIIAIAWAIVAYEYAVNLREQTALADRELTARVDASQQGRVLPPSTLPPARPSNPVDDAKSAGFWILGGLALAAGALTIPLFLKK